MLDECDTLPTRKPFAVLQEGRFRNALMQLVVSYITRTTMYSGVDHIGNRSGQVKSSQIMYHGAFRGVHGERSTGAPRVVEHRAKPGPNTQQKESVEIPH